MSSKIAGDRPRLGSLDLTNATVRDQLDKLGVKVYDLTDKAMGYINHDTFAEAPQVVATIGEQLGAATSNMANAQATLDYAPPIPADTSSPNR